MLFKIKKYLLPAIISASKHLEYKSFVDKVYKEYSEFIGDEVWGVRKVCIENTADIIKNLKHTEHEKF